jgi:aerobic-type carbon monoxide dehydrogenase small subunit (CoxS/CutS family)
MLNGRAVYSCTVLAVDADGGDVLTVEGLSYNNHLHPLQELFVEYDALQCGYCTPGFLMGLVSLFESGKRIGLDEIRESISGVLCRCGAYPNIVKAALEYSKKFVNNNV